MRRPTFIDSLKTGGRLAKTVVELILAIPVIIGFVWFLDGQGVIQFPWLHRATVPDAISLSEARARSLMNESELTAKIICMDPMEEEVGPNTVYKTDPRAETKVDRGSTVEVFVKPPC